MYIINIHYVILISEDEYSMNSRFCDNLVGIVEEYVQNTTPLRYICVAILLNQTHVLTAAHCVISNSTYHVRYKSGNVSVSTYDYNEVTDKWIHPNYNENILGCKGNDVAILKIKTSISHALPTILATSQFNYSTAFICKWNRKQTENATQLSNPEFIPVTVHDTATCKRAEENVNETYMHDNICASGNNISLKEGDTGSPAYVFNNDGKIILIGFLYCEVQLSEAIFANSTYPVAITNISTFIAWIQYLSIDTTIIESSRKFEITFVSILALIVIILIFVGLLMYLSNNEDYEQNPTPESIPLNKL